MAFLFFFPLSLSLELSEPRSTERSGGLRVMQGWNGRETEQQDRGGRGGRGEGEDNLFILCLKWSLDSCVQIGRFVFGQLILWLILDWIGVK